MRYLALHSLIMVCATVAAQQDSSAQQNTGVDVQAPGVRVRTEVDRSKPENRTNTARAQKTIVRASQLIGLNVQNANDDTIGEINDIVIDPNNGQIRYIAFASGGFLGLGEKLFAVPWKSFECRNDGDNHKVVLNVDKAAFENAKGFDKDSWPDMANEQWQLENNRAFEPRSANRRVALPPTSR